MGFWNDVLNGAIKGYSTSKPAKDKKRKWQFEELEQTEYLFSSKYLNELLDEARTKREHESILEHMYRNEATDVESYSKIEKKIIDKFY